MPPDFWKSAPALSASLNQGSKLLSPQSNALKTAPGAVFKRWVFQPPSHDIRSLGNPPPRLPWGAQRMAATEQAKTVLAAYAPTDLRRTEDEPPTQPSYVHPRCTQTHKTNASAIRDRSLGVRHRCPGTQHGFDCGASCSLTGTVLRGPSIPSVCGSKTQHARAHVHGSQVLCYRPEVLHLPQTSAALAGAHVW